MKKMSLNPLELDKQTIAQLDANQLQNVTGGAGIIDWIKDILGGGGGGSTGCGSGSSQCRVGGGK